MLITGKDFQYAICKKLPNPTNFFAPCHDRVRDFTRNATLQWDREPQL